MDGVPLSMDGGTFGGRFLHGVHPPAAASSMDEDIHPWMRFIHRWCATVVRVLKRFLGTMYPPYTSEDEGESNRVIPSARGKVEKVAVPP